MAFYIIESDEVFLRAYRFIDTHLKKYGYKNENKNELDKKIIDEFPEDYILKNKKFLVRGDGKTFLHLAAADGNMPLLRFLLEAGHDNYIQDKEGRTPLYEACSKLKLAAVQLLLDYDVKDKNARDYDAYVNLGDDTFYTYHENWFRHEIIPLVAVIESSAKVTADELKEALQDENSISEDFSSLTTKQATEQTAAHIVSELISKNVNINLQTGDNNFSPLHRAINLGKTLIVKTLIDSGKVNFRLRTNEGLTPLHMIVEYRSKGQKKEEKSQMQQEKEIIELIIPYLKVINVPDIHGNTPLHAAVICSNVDVVETLCKSDHLFQKFRLLGLQNLDGNTAIHEAVKAAARGPKILTLLLRLATEDDLEIRNHLIVDGRIVELGAGETVREMASRLLAEVPTLCNLSEEIKTTTKKIKDSFNEKNIESVNLEDVSKFDPIDSTQQNFDLLSQAIRQLIDIQHPHIVQLENFWEIQKKIIDIRSKRTLSEDNTDWLIKKVNQLTKDLNALFDSEYLDALKSVKGEEYKGWKQQLVPRRDLNPSDATHQTKLQKLYEDFNTAVLEFNKNSILNTKTLFEENIRGYIDLKEYQSLEFPYQYLACLSISTVSDIVNYEAQWRGILHHSSNREELLQAHLALAGLYKMLRINQAKLFSLSTEASEASEAMKWDLYSQESFHYSEAYKFTQGEFDSEAHVVLQREMGVALGAKLGTYNIQQCVAVIAHDPITNKVVLSHFDRYSGPLKFIDQILEEFPHASEESKIDLYLTGGRDRGGILSDKSTTLISDSNIDQVLKQIYAHKEKFNIKATDLGNPLSPQAVVFDPKQPGLQPAMPNRADISLDSRAAEMNFKFSKADYLYPLDRMDFSQSAISRKKSLSDEEIKHRHDVLFNQYEDNSSERKKHSEMWKFNQVLQPLIALMTEAYEFAAKRAAQSAQGLFQDLDRYIQDLSNREQLLNFDFSFLRQQNEQLSTDTVATLYQSNQATLPSHPQPKHDSAPLSLDDISDKFVDLNELALQEPPSKKICLSNRRKRETGACLYSWEDVDEFNFEKENPRDIERINIDSEVFLEHLKTVDELTRSQFLHLAATCKITGNRQLTVQRLIHLEQLKPHLQKVSKISGGLTQGIFAEDALADLFKGDPTTAISLVGLMSVSHGLGNLANWINKSPVNKLLKLSTPFMRRGTSLLNGVDLIKQIKALKNGNKDAIAGVVGDSVNIGIDLAEAGIEVAEMSSETMALLGISSVTGPLGELAGAIVMLSVKIFSAVRSVEQLDHLVALSDWEKFKEGWRAFLGMSREKYIQVIVDLIQEYARLLLEKVEIFKTHPEFKYFIFSSIREIAKNCRVINRDPETCSKPAGGRESTSLCTETVCVPVFAPIQNSSVYFEEKRIGFQLEKEELTAPSGSEFICLPTSESNEGKSLPEAGAYSCDGAIGLTNKNSTGVVAFFNLGDGEDHAIGFRDLSNIFIINNGAKAYKGGDQSDIFIIQAEDVITAVNKDDRWIKGLDGGDGIDSLILQEFRPASDRIEVDFATGYLRYGNKTLQIAHLERLSGGALPLTVTAACDTQMINTSDGSTLKNDTIFIPKKDRCDYAMKMQLNSNVNVTNAAEIGDFTYAVLNREGDVLINLLANRSNAENLKHQIVFNKRISEVSSIAFSSQLLQIYFKSETGNAKGLKFDLNANPSNNSMRFYFMDNAELKVGNKNIYYFQQDLNKTVPEIMEEYAPIARLLNLICALTTLTIEGNEHIVIGHNGHEVMQNNPNVFRTHLHGNGGEGIFVIESGMAPLHRSRLPLPEVVIYRHSKDTHTDTLDFRELMEQILTEYQTIAKIFFIQPNLSNNLGQDILLMLGIETPKKIIEIINIRLKDAALQDWHKEYLHIILDVAPQRIVGANSDLRLEPIPLVFDQAHEIASVGINDVEENTVIIIPRSYQVNSFYHHGTNLIWTNTLNRSHLVKPFTLIVPDFYREAKLKTLSLQFSDKKIDLQTNLAEIRVEDFEYAMNQQKNHLRAESLAILHSKPLDLSSISQPTNVEGTDSRQAYLSEEQKPLDILSSKPLNLLGINGIDSTENEIKKENLRRRREVNIFKNSMPTLFSKDRERNAEDATLEMASKYYDRWDREQNKKANRQKKWAKPAAKVTVITQSIKPVSERSQSLTAAKSLPEKSVNTITRQQKPHMMKEIIKINPFDKKNASKAPIPQTNKQYNSNSFTKHKSVNPVNYRVANGNLLKGIENKPSKSSDLQLATPKPNQYSYQSTREKRSVGKVNAPLDFNGTLMLFQYLLPKFAQKPRMNPKLARWIDKNGKGIKKMNMTYIK